MALRLTQVRLLSTTSMAGAIRASMTKIAVTVTYGGKQRIAHHNVLQTLTYAGKQRIGKHEIATTLSMAGRQRVTGHWLLSVASIHNAFYPDFLQGGQIWGFTTWDVVIPPFLVPELNPYRPTVPDEFFNPESMGDVFYYFARENQEIIRQQHNITQAGDSTYPFQVILKSHKDKAFTLGSTGRFYHEDYGLIQARYVKFGPMIDTGIRCAPVGLMQINQDLNWVVTNDFTRSHKDLVVGLLSTYELPEQDDYGWVICDGPNLLEIDNTDSIDSKRGETFSWSGTNKVSNRSVGRIIGRRVNEPISDRLTPGQFKVQFESFSPKDIEILIQGTIDEIGEQLAAIEASITSLNSLTTLPATIAAIQSTITTLTNRLALEEANRQLHDNALKSLIEGIEGVTEGELNFAVSGLQRQIDDLTANTNTQFAALNAALISLQTQVNAIAIINLDAVNDAIVAILSRLTILEAKPIGILPAVDGAVPPGLLYLDDGNLVYVEVY